MARTGPWLKMLVGGLTLCVGGPALIIWISPSEDELIKKYNPELQKRALANREARRQDFDGFVGKLKDYSKSDKTIWEAAANEEAKAAMEPAVNPRSTVADEIQRRREEIRKQSIGRN